MTFTGSELSIKRNFFTQTGEIGFSMTCAVDNTSGLYNFGLSGTQGVLNFSLQSGKLYYGSQFLHTYQSNETFLVEAQFTSGSTNVSKDNVPMLLGSPKTTGTFDYFYMSRASEDLGATFNLLISGNNNPIYTITNQGYLIASGQNAVTGYFINQSAFPIRIFDSSMQASVNYDFGKLATTISGINTGTFAYTGDYDIIDFSQPILTTFNTNFGNTDILFYITDARSFNKFVLLTGPTDFTFNSDGELNRNLTWLNYSGGFVTTSYDTILNFSLTYVTGSGTYSDETFATNIPYTGTIYGSFAQSGIMTGIASFPTGNNNSSGVYSINLSKFSWATGRATGFFSGISTGLASGIGYTGRAISAFTGLATGLIYDGSGTLNLGIITGFSIGNAYSLDYPSYIDATGFINISGMSLGDSFYIGNSVSPIVKGVQFVNETGLVYYLSGNSQHQVNGVYNGGYIVLTALTRGSVGNGITISEYQCSQGGGFTSYSPFLTGGIDNGTTGNLVVAIGAYTGAPNAIITGSGNYSLNIAGTGNGNFIYTRTFTGAWDFYTGIDLTNLVSMKTPGSFNSNAISGSGVFSPNSQIAFMIVNNTNNINTDGARLIISGSDVLTPINQILYTPNV